MSLSENENILGILKLSRWNFSHFFRKSISSAFVGFKCVKSFLLFCLKVGRNTVCWLYLEFWVLIEVFSYLL